MYLCMRLCECVCVCVNTAQNRTLSFKDLYLGLNLLRNDSESPVQAGLHLPRETHLINMLCEMSMRGEITQRLNAKSQTPQLNVAWLSAVKLTQIK